MSTSQVTKNSAFNEEHLLHVLKHYLPTQGPLKDFVHHNTLHAFQDTKFYDAIFKASKMFGYQVTFSMTEYRNLYAINRIQPEILDRVIRERKGSESFEELREKVLHKEYSGGVVSRVGKLRNEWKKFYPVDLDNAVHPILFRIICSYLDQGIAISPFPFEDKGILDALRGLENNSFVSFFKTKRARTLLFDASLSIEQLLKMLVGREEYFDEYVYDQQFSHRGWSGMVATVSDRPETLLYPKKICLEEIIKLELLLEIDALENRLGSGWKPLGEKTDFVPIDLFADIEHTERQEVVKIWQDAFEWSYYDTVISGLKYTLEKRSEEEIISKKSFQAIFCIDEREYSLRTYVEGLDPTCETLGAPGFFGVEFYFHPAHAKFYEKLCPAPVTPKYLIKEVEEENGHVHREKEIMYTKDSHMLLRGVISSYALGIPSLGKLFSNLINPEMSPAIADAFDHMDSDAELTVEHTAELGTENGLQIGFTLIEMTDRVEKLLRCIGLTKDFADIVYLVGHGSSSANNPHHGAHDCGACSGRPGAVNSRVFAFMANHTAVRKELEMRGITIPQATQFIGALHDTASDQIQFYDKNKLSEKNKQLFITHEDLFEKALDLNAKERSRRFMSINTKNPLKKIREAIKRRSVSYFEPRPELGHGTNALCIVGSRSLTKDLFLDRRAFLNSYDYKSDPDGKLLLNVVTPLGIVCGGINLEYYFSRMDNYKLGAGTKLPHNVMGLIGVANSSDGDLRPGLPLQMIEVHDPVRLLMIIEHRPDVVLSTISSSPALYEWFINEWINLVVVDPVEKKFFVFKNGAFVPYTPLVEETPMVKDISHMLETIKKMESNHILDATRENIPVHILTK